MRRIKPAGQNWDVLLSGSVLCDDRSIGWRVYGLQKSCMKPSLDPNNAFSRVDVPVS